MKASTDGPACRYGIRGTGIVMNSVASARRNRWRWGVTGFLLFPVLLAALILGVFVVDDYREQERSIAARTRAHSMALASMLLLEREGLEEVERQHVPRLEAARARVPDATNAIPFVEALEREIVAVGGSLRLRNLEQYRRDFWNEAAIDVEVRWPTNRARAVLAAIDRQERLVDLVRWHAVADDDHPLASGAELYLTIFAVPEPDELLHDDFRCERVASPSRRLTPDWVHELSHLHEQSLCEKVRARIVAGDRAVEALNRARTLDRLERVIEALSSGDSRGSLVEQLGPTFDSSGVAGAPEAPAPSNS